MGLTLEQALAAVEAERDGYEDNYKYNFLCVKDVYVTDEHEREWLWLSADVLELDDTLNGLGLYVNSDGTEETSDNDWSLDNDIAEFNLDSEEAARLESEWIAFAREVAAKMLEA
jgi:hypothetical protein